MFGKDKNTHKKFLEKNIFKIKKKKINYSVASSKNDIFPSSLDELIKTFYSPPPSSPHLRPFLVNFPDLVMPGASQ